MYKKIILNEFEQANIILKLFTKNQENIKSIEKAAIILSKAFKNGNKVLSCGNGGSHCDAMHFAQELTGRYRESRFAYPAIVISDTSHITCVGNDFGYNLIFSRYIEAVGKKGDVLFAISTSGNSLNILKAIESAHSIGMYIISLVGKDGGKIKNKSNIEIIVPYSGYSDRIQEIHIKIIHILIRLIELEMSK
ncbi:MAG: D-sedoheptulose 7-phosphate isomerase [Arsenophonus sp.]|nr:MAG: D-sedoheptulose 7-phosphate isomerase [Arsenophonus sp.]